MFSGKAQQLTIFVSETDTYQDETLYKAVLELVKRKGCRGATALRGVTGFGARSVIHTSHILRMSMDMPIVIIAIDRPSRLNRILAPLREIAPQALIIVRDLEVIQSGGSFKEGLPEVAVSEVMCRQIVTVYPESSLTDVVDLLLDKGFTAVPVVDKAGKVVGMVSDGDLLTRGGMRVTLSLKKATDREFVRDLHSSLENRDWRVSDVMTREVQSISRDEILGRAAKLMVQKGLKRLPVVDNEGTLVGILGRLDVLNTIAAVHLPEWHPEVAPLGRNSTVADVMNRDVPMVHESAGIEQIFELLVASSHKRVVVVDDQRHVTGIIADSDLISRVDRQSWPGLVEILVSKVPLGKASDLARNHLRQVHAHSAGQLMTRDVVVVREGMPVASALALSAEKRVKRLPVVDMDGALVGIVGRTEMMRALLVDTPS